MTLAHEAEACRRLWVNVAAAAIGDAAKNVVLARRDGDEEAVIAREMRYFRSRSYRQVCELAGLSCRPDHIERMLRSDKVAASLKKMARAYGVLSHQEGSA